MLPTHALSLAPDELLQREWLLADGTGGFAMGSAAPNASLRMLTERSSSRIWLFWVNPPNL